MKTTDNKKLREKGQVWTPEWVAEIMASYVLFERPENVFDPAVGQGALLATIKNYAKKINHIVQISGNEIDKDLQSELSVVLSDFELNNINFQDFLYYSSDTKWDAIIANPPFVRHHKLSSQQKKQAQAISQKILSQALDGRSGLHIYFLLLSLEILALNGRLAFIMPADTFEGVSANILWDWIGQNYCLDAIITFSPNSSPFPNFDTNVSIILLQNSCPKSDFWWIKVETPNNKKLIDWIESDFSSTPISGAYSRKVKEGIKTGLTRPQSSPNGEIKLSNFAKTMRGIATGANEFFFMTKEFSQYIGIPSQYLKRAIGRTRDISGNILTEDLLNKLSEIGRPTYLLSIGSESLQELPISLQNYIQKGELSGLSERPLIRQRKPWYRMEKREIPQLLFAYLGRRNSRFILNSANALPLTSFLCIYPNNDILVKPLWESLNHPSTIDNLLLIGKSYGSGAIKVEPKSLENLIIPDNVLEETGLYSYLRDQSQHQLSLF